MFVTDIRSRLQCFAIRWNSTEAITASCKVWVVTPTSTRTKLVAATFMDKECPETQTRNSSEHLKVRALRAGNAGRSKSLSRSPILRFSPFTCSDASSASDGLGTVRLEIHRAQNTVIGFRRTKPNQTCGAFKFECTKDATVGKLPFVTFEFQMVLGTPSMEVIKCGGADDGTDEGSQYIESQALGSQHTGMVLPGSCPVTEAHNPGQCSGAQKRKRQRQRPRAWSGDDISDGIQEVNQNELDRVKRTKAQNDKLEVRPSYVN